MTKSERTEGMNNPSLRRKIEDALSQGGPWNKFDPFVAGSAVEALIFDERRRTVREFVRHLNLGISEDEEKAAIAAIFPPSA